MNGRYLITRETLDRDGALQHDRIIAISDATGHEWRFHPALTDEDRAGLLDLAHNLDSQLSGRSHS